MNKNHQTTWYFFKLKIYKKNTLTNDFSNFKTENRICIYEGFKINTIVITYGSFFFKNSFNFFSNFEITEIT